MLQCPNKEARELRKSALAAFEAEGKKRKIPRPVMEKIYHLLTNYMQGREGVVAAPGSNALDVVTNQQMTIGLKLLRLGFLAKGWKDAIEEGGTEQSEHKLTHLQWILWSTVMEEYNDLRLGNRIQWYVANRHNVLLVYDSRLTTFDITTIHRMS